MVRTASSFLEPPAPKSTRPRTEPTHACCKRAVVVSACTVGPRASLEIAARELVWCSVSRLATTALNSLARSRAQEPDVVRRDRPDGRAQLHAGGDPHDRRARRRRTPPACLLLRASMLSRPHASPTRRPRPAAPSPPPQAPSSARPTSAATLPASAPPGTSKTQSSHSSSPSSALSSQRLAARPRRRAPAAARRPGCVCSPRAAEGPP